MSTVADLNLVVARATRRACWATIVVADGGGTHGFGECSGGGETADMAASVATLRASLVGLHVNEARIAAGEIGAGLSGPLRHGLELALADLQARVESGALDLLPSARFRDSVEVYANINRAEGERTPEHFARLAERAAGDGFRAVKVAPFDGADTAGGLQRLRAIRRSVGKRVELMVDCHQRTTFDELVAILPAMEELGVVWLEDPFRLSDVHLWQELAVQTRMPLAGGEQARGLADVQPLLEAGILSYVLPDVRIAGVGGCHQILAAALRLGTEPSLHNPWGPIATATSLLVAASTPRFQRLELAYGEEPWRAGLVQPPERVAEGRLPVQNGPGLGASLVTSHPQARLLVSRQDS